MQRNFFAREGVETLNDDDDDDNDNDDDEDEDDEVDALWIYKSFISFVRPRESPTEVLPRKRCNHAVATTTTTTTTTTTNCFRKLLHFLLRYVRNVRATLNVENASDSTLREKAGTGCVSFGASKNGRDPSDLIQQPYPPTKFSRHHSIGKGTDIQRGLLTSLSR
ncbi:hypothetical protein HZH66_008427 [Vespula vulgaris]|uniref:Uncharacterized protein n=1 Tax=Vespula vulgaris TaxID=7454 RepID=A0A834JTB7_VESVU|nr:hypothetical protein HZH66_008427 [Vespula vulgaris]